MTTKPEPTEELQQWRLFDQLIEPGMLVTLALDPNKESADENQPTDKPIKCWIESDIHDGWALPFFTGYGRTAREAFYDAAIKALKEINA